jgi:hypothetical protein
MVVKVQPGCVNSQGPAVEAIVTASGLPIVAVALTSAGWDSATVRLEGVQGEAIEVTDNRGVFSFAAEVACEEWRLAWMTPRWEA